MYIFFSFLLAAFFISLAVSHYFITSKKSARILKFISVFCLGAGLLATSGAIAAFFLSLSKSGLSSEDMLWLRDTFTAYLKICVFFVVPISALALLSGLAQPKLKILRVLMILLSSVILLIAGLLFSFIAETDKLSVGGFIKILSIGFSVLMQSFAYFDFSRKEKTLSKEK